MEKYCKHGLIPITCLYCKDEYKAEETKTKKYDKQRRYRNKCKEEGRCPHCGKMCAPYSACEERRKYHRELKSKTHYAKRQSPRLKVKYIIPILDIHKIVREFDEDLPETDDTYKAAIIMISGLSVGQGPKNLRMFTKYSYDLINRVIVNLRQGRIWLKNNEFCFPWIDEKNPGKAQIGFILDAMVGAGILGKNDKEEYYLRPEAKDV